MNVITDKNGTIEYVNKSFSKISGYKKKEVLGKKPSILKLGKHTKDFYNILWSTILNGNIRVGELINRSKKGDLYYESVTITPIMIIT